MTSKQKEHVEFLKEEFTRELEEKYKRGAEEHGGDIWKLDALALLDAALEETIDQYVYLKTLRQLLIGRGPCERS